VTEGTGEAELLSALDPPIDVRPGQRFLDDGNLITLAGISAGINMALHPTKRLAGVDRAREALRGIHYDPAPPA